LLKRGQNAHAQTKKITTTTTTTTYMSEFEGFGAILAAGVAIACDDKCDALWSSLELMESWL
jgi:23S rRNA maturation mini-RNase III